ncbi:hypothetical protein NL676_006345 [Syzygium grande]|nr:hypothetical protein NL676_006345 [Syzygium grande]
MRSEELFTKIRRRSIGSMKKGRDCFEIYAKGLHITLGDRPVYWQWKTDSDNHGIEMAELVKTSLVSGEVAGLEQHEEADSEPETDSPDGSIQEGQAELPDEVGTEKWHELEVGRFHMSERNAGEMLFAMEQSFDRWRKGLFIKSVEIKAI